MFLERSLNLDVPIIRDVMRRDKHALNVLRNAFDVLKTSFLSDLLHQMVGIEPLLPRHALKHRIHKHKRFARADITRSLKKVRRILTKLNAGSTPDVQLGTMLNVPVGAMVVTVAFRIGLFCFL